MKKNIFWGLLAIVVLGFLLWDGGKIFLKKDKTTPTIPSVSAMMTPTSVTVQKMETMPLVVSQKYIGFVIPIHAVEIHPFISGFIQEVLIAGGDNVQANQTLFILEQSQYIAEMDLQMANIMSSSAAFENAKMYYERLKAAGDKAVSQSDLDAAKAQFLTTGAEVGAAVAQYDAAQVMYNYTFVNAPITGVLGNVTVTKGQYVSPQSSALAYLVQTTPMRVVFSISNATYLEEKAVNPKALFRNKQVRLKLADGRMYDLSGQVQFLDNAVTASTSSVQAFADFENVDKTLLPNAYVDVFVEENLSDALLIPQKFVTMKKEGLFVWIVDEKGMLKEQPIVVSDQTIENSFYLVTGGLKAGDFIVTQKPAEVNLALPVQMKIEAPIRPASYTAAPIVSGDK